MHCTYTPKNSFKCVTVLSRSNWNLEMLVVEERGKPSLFEKNSSEPSLRYEYSGNKWEGCKQPLSSIVAVEWNKCLLSLLAEVSHDEAWDLCEQGSVCLVYFYFLIAWECCTCTILPNSDSSPRSSPPFIIVSPSRPSGWGYRDTLASPRTLWTVDCIVSLARAALNEDHKQFVILLQ